MEKIKYFCPAFFDAQKKDEQQNIYIQPEL